MLMIWMYRMHEIAVVGKMELFFFGNHVACLLSSVVFVVVLSVVAIFHQSISPKVMRQVPIS